MSDQKDPPLGSREHDDGWAWINQRMGSKDEARMRGYSEDIDSLLVLDGLFSAVVTGFVVVAVSMLQEDTGQTSALLLSSISAQLASLTLSPPFINATVTISPAQPFRPSPAARWINSLWFLSLVLSLASALLGILAKQWIREYLQWSMNTSPPRENVLLREIRFEAWDAWHTATIISSVPVLLELAVILFICGLAVYVWTLDLVVAVVITISIALFLSSVAVITFIPAFCRHCPYKSPTAWAVTRLVRWIAKSYQFLITLLPPQPIPSASITGNPTILTLYNNHFNVIHSITYLRPDATLSWRVRDFQAAQLETLRDGTGHKVPYTSALAVDLNQGLLESMKFLQNVSEDPPSPAIITDVAATLLSPTTLRTYAAAISEADHLFRALVMLLMDRPGPSALLYVAQCAQSMNPPLTCVDIPEYIGITPDVRLAELAIDGCFQNVSIWYMLSRLNSIGDGYMGPLADHPSTKPARKQRQMRHDLTAATSVLEAIQSSLAGHVVERDVTCAFLPPDDDEGLLEYEESPLRDSQFTAMGYILVYRFRSLVSRALDSHILSLSHEHAITQLLQRWAAELLCALELVVFQWNETSPLRRKSRRDCFVILADTYNSIMESPHKIRFDTLFSNLRRDIFITIVMSEYRIRWTSGFALDIGSPSEDALEHSETSWVTLAVQYAEASVHTRSPEDLSIFAQVVNQALEHTNHSTVAAIDTLCNLMIRAVHESASQEFHRPEKRFLLERMWTSQLLHFGAGRDDPIASILVDRSPTSFLELHAALRAGDRQQDRILTGRLVSVLLVSLRITSSDDDLASPEVPDPLRSSTALVGRWPGPIAADGRVDFCPTFCWAVGHWLGEISRTAVDASHVQNLPGYAEDIRTALRRITEEVRCLPSRGDIDVGRTYGSWLDMIVHQPSGQEPKSQFGGETEPAMIELLVRYAREEFLALIHELLNGLTNIPDPSDVITNRLRSLHQYILAG